MKVVDRQVEEEIEMIDCYQVCARIVETEFTFEKVFEKKHFQMWPFTIIYLRHAIELIWNTDPQN